MATTATPIAILETPLFPSLHKAYPYLHSNAHVTHATLLLPSILAPKGSNTWVAMKPPEPLPASTTMWCPSKGFSGFGASGTFIRMRLRRNEAYSFKKLLCSGLGTKYVGVRCNWSRRKEWYLNTCLLVVGKLLGNSQGLGQGSAVIVQLHVHTTQLELSDSLVKLI